MSSRDRAEKKRKKKKEKGGKRAPRVSSNKRGSQYFERKKHFNFNNPF
jgi:hypothetical protein